MIDDNDPNAWLHFPAPHHGEAGAKIYLAAHRIWGIVRWLCARKLREVDPSEAAARLEAAVEAAQRAGAHPVNWEAYLLKAVGRDITREQKLRLAKQQVTLDLDKFVDIHPRGSDVERDRILDDLMEKIRAGLDPKGRVLLECYLAEMSWAEIAKRENYADAHSALVQFKRRIRRVCDELGLTTTVGKRR